MKPFVNEAIVYENTTVASGWIQYDWGLAGISDTKKSSTGIIELELRFVGYVYVKTLQLNITAKTKTILSL
jgi:hypothetical protein